MLAPFSRGPLLAWAGLETGAEYLRSGSYERVVSRRRIQGLEPKTLVVWGDRDPVLNVRDAAKFGNDLPHCAGVRIVPDAGHSPQLDQPALVEGHLRDFLREV